MRDDNRSIHTRSIEYICTQLKLEFGTLTAADIAYLEAKLKEPYQSGAPLLSGQPTSMTYGAPGSQLQTLQLLHC